MNIELAYKECCKLIDDFEKGYETFMAKNYDEASVRQSFINPFFETVLGWNVTPIEKNPNLIEVQVEKAQRQKKEEGTKRADYAFHIVKNGKRSVAFFVEAKKPSEELDEAKHYLQVKSYARYEGLKISVLTDFQQFHIVDCRAKYNPKLPKEGDHKKFVYTDFRDKEKFAIVYNLFNRDAIYNDSINKYTDTLKKVKLDRVAKDPIDIIGDEFLSYIEQLRLYIAKALKYNDYSLTGEQLTEATQKIIDRLVFTRFLEDKNIEDELWVKKWAESKTPYSTFIKDCKGFADLYNGVVYNAHSLIDKVGFVKNEDWFAVVCKEMIDPYSEFKFNFNYIPIHILGSVYERFLGSVIRATPKDVKSEEKIEVRKAGGVYYTPKYIVDYIVENTIGKQINGKKPKEISKLHFADIACGSGSFLIGVYDCILKYHTNYYNKNIKQAETDGCIKIVDNTYRLSIRQKRDILLNNVFGVDIDAQAVEVTQLSLFLKMLEDETQETLRLKGNVLFDKIKILPNLKDNIVCGNSLIGSDINDGLLFDFETLQDLNILDYIDAFPKIMGNGGFDAIVGNPPYVTIGGKEDMMNSAEEIAYFNNKYISSKYKPNLYAFFYEQGYKILKQNGIVSYIVPRTILDNKYYSELRVYFVNNTIINSILKIDYEVFDNATTGGTSICFLKKGVDKNNIIKANIIKCEKDFLKNEFINIKQSDILYGEHKSISIKSSEDSSIVDKIDSISEKLLNYCSVNNGVNTGNAANILLSKNKETQNHRKILEGKDINRYSINWGGFWINYDKDIKSKIDIKTLNTRQNKIDLALRDEKIFITPKIIIRQTADSIIACYDETKFISRHSTHCIVNDGKKINLFFLLGLLNSTLIKYYYQKLIPEKGKAFAEVKGVNVKQLPIPKLDFKLKHTKDKHDKIVLLVTQLLQIKKQVPKTDKDKNFIESQCSSYENQIDNEVYKLYNLTPQEIEIVKAATKK